MRASDLFLAMGNCEKIRVIGTRIDTDGRLSSEWDEYSQMHRAWHGQIISMRPESKGGVNWIVEMRQPLKSMPVVKLFVHCEER